MEFVGSIDFGFGRPFVSEKKRLCIAARLRATIAVNRGRDIEYVREDGLKVQNLRARRMAEAERVAVVEVKVVVVRAVKIVIENDAEVLPQNGFHSEIENRIGGIVKGDERLRGPENAVEIEGAASAVKAGGAIGECASRCDDLSATEARPLPQLIEAPFERILQRGRAAKGMRPSSRAVISLRVPIIMNWYRGELSERV